MGKLMQELRFTLRRIGRNRFAALVVVMSLALGIGLNVVVFSLVNMLLLRPLPISRPESLVRLYTGNPAESMFRAFSYPDYVDYSRETAALAGLVAERYIPINLGYEGRADLIWGALVSGNYFDVLGVRAAVGRTLQPGDDDVPDAHAVAVLNYDLWRERFGADPSAVGRSIFLNGRSYTIVGVAARGFAGTFAGSKAEVWVPIMMQRQMMPVGDRLEQRGARWLTVTGRLKPGVSLGQARSILGRTASRLAQEFPDSNKDVAVNVVRFEDDVLPFQAKGTAVTASVVMLAAAGAVLLIACANLGSILLAQAAARQQEFAVRQAIGADRLQLMRQFLLENLLLALLGGGLALVLTVWVNGLIARLPFATFLPADFTPRLDGRVVSFALLVSLAVGLLLGLISALQATRFNLVAALKGDALDAGRRGGFRLRSVLVVAQVMLSLVLLICAGLFIKSLRNSLEVDLGFEPRNVTVASVNLGLQGYEEPRGRAWYRQLLERVQGLPGVVQASLSSGVPLELGGGEQVEVKVEGAEARSIDYFVVTPGYFATMGIPLVRGRDFTPREGGSAVESVVINEAIAEQFWPNGEAVGQQFQVGGVPAIVVGVVRNSKYGSVGESPRPFLYIPFSDQYEPAMTLHVKAAAGGVRLVDSIRQQVRTFDENLPVFNDKTLDDHVRFSLLPTRLGASAIGGFGLLALVLTAVGTYGVMMQYVSRRRREIGIRMALGAEPQSVVRRVLGQGMRLVAIGAVLGLALAVAVSRFLSSLLFGVQGVEVGVFAGITALLLATALCATFFPARRAARVDPVSVLKEQ